MNLINDYMKAPGSDRVIDLSSNQSVAIAIRTLAQEIGFTYEGELFDHQILTNIQPLFYEIDGGSTWGAWTDVAHVDSALPPPTNAVRGIQVFYTSFDGTTGIRKELDNTDTQEPVSCLGGETTECYQALNEDCGCVDDVLENLEELSENSLSFGTTNAEACDLACRESQIRDLITVYNEMTTHFNSLRVGTDPSGLNVFLFDHSPEVLNLVQNSMLFFSENNSVQISPSNIQYSNLILDGIPWIYTNLGFPLNDNNPNLTPSRNLRVVGWLYEIPDPTTPLSDATLLVLYKGDAGNLNVYQFPIFDENFTSRFEGNRVFEDNANMGAITSNRTDVFIDRVEILEPVELIKDAIFTGTSGLISPTLIQNNVKVRIYFTDGTNEIGWFPLSEELASENGGTISSTVCTNLNYSNVSIDQSITPEYVTVTRNDGSDFDIYFYNEEGEALDPSTIVATDAFFSENRSPVLPLPAQNYTGQGIEIDYLAANGEVESDFFYIYTTSSRTEPFFRRCFFTEPDLTINVEEIEAECMADLEIQIETDAIEEFNREVSELLNTELVNTRTKCIDGIEERFDITYTDHQYHFTLYYYDQSGNLVQTVPPAGVDRLDVSPSDFVTTRTVTGESIQTYIGTEPNHTLATTYAYNSVGQMIHQFTPDGGEMRYWYDRQNRVRLSQHARQLAQSQEDGVGGLNRYAYTKYDHLSRPIESGQLENLEIQRVNLLEATNPLPGINGSIAAATSEELVNTLDLLDDLSFPDRDLADNAYACIELKETYYTDPYQGYQTNDDFTRNRITAAVSRETRNGGVESAHIFSYDVHGNVEELWHEVRGLGVKHTAYNFDLISGNVLDVNYNEGRPDQFFHHYEYDADNRIVSVETSSNGEYYHEDAHYFYYAHGAMARTEHGDQKVQGCDYLYNMQGWMKGVNTPALLAQQADLGGDGHQGHINQYIARDEFAFALSYYQDDYTPIAGNATTLGAANQTIWSQSQLAAQLLGQQEGLYNGNISHMITQVHRLGEYRNLDPSNTPVGEDYGLRAQSFVYDQLQRLKAAYNYDTYAGNAWASRGDTPEALDAAYEYDASGNIKTLKRWGNSGALIDNLTYTYNTVNGRLLSNRLLSVHDGAGAVEGWDLETLAGEYTYDAIGNMVSNKKGSEASDAVEDIVWRLDGKIKSITLPNDHTLEFFYDAMGNRVIKQDINVGGDSFRISYYVKDASGNTMANYAYEGEVIENPDGSRFLNNIGFDLTEQPIYGSKRCGLRNERIPVINLDSGGGEITLGPITEYAYETGERVYELTEHRGNVMVILSDIKVGKTTFGQQANHYLAVTKAANDYYAFGSQIAERSAFSPSYRYGYQGSEKDDEVQGEGVTYSTMYRFLDTKIGRWFSIDPKANELPYQSTYCSMDNNPIKNNDPMGDKVRYKGNIVDKISLRIKNRRLRRNSKTYKSMFNDLKKSDETYFYKYDNSSRYSHGKKTINVSRGRLNEVSDNSKGDESTSRASSTFTHETAHAWLEDRDLVPKKPKNSGFNWNNSDLENIITDLQFREKGRIFHEENASFITNMVRKELQKSKGLKSPYLFFRRKYDLTTYDISITPSDKQPWEEGYQSEQDRLVVRPKVTTIEIKIPTDEEVKKGIYGIYKVKPR